MPERFDYRLCLLYSSRMSSSSLEKEARLYCCFRTSRRLACLSSCSSTSEKSKFAHRTGKFIGLTITMGP